MSGLGSHSGIKRSPVTAGRAASLCISAALVLGRCDSVGRRARAQRIGRCAVRFSQVLRGGTVGNSACRPASRTCEPILPTALVRKSPLSCATRSRKPNFHPQAGRRYRPIQQPARCSVPFSHTICNGTASSSDSTWATSTPPIPSTRRRPILFQDNSSPLTTLTTRLPLTRDPR